eukprot:gene891-5685_t
MKNTSTKFLDALIGSSRIELFSSNVQLLYPGDLVNSLYIIMDGESQGSNIYGKPSLLSTRGSQGKPSLSSMKGSGMKGDMSLTSITGFSGEGYNLARSKSETYGEVAFFTENPSDEAVITSTIVKVLSLSKEHWDRLSHEFPLMNHLILNNMMHRTSKGLVRMMFETVMSTPIASDSMRDDITELMNLDEEEATDINNLKTGLVKDVKALMMPEEKLKFNRDVEVAHAVQLYMKKHIAGQTDALLNACRSGDTDGIKRRMDQKVNLDCMDYDLRTGLMLAAAHGHAECLKQMLEAGADPNLLDAIGCSALWEAVDKSRPVSAEVLRKHGAKLGLTPDLESHMIFQCVTTGNKEKLESYLKMGANPNLANVDGRTALHIACRGGQQHM